MGSHGTINELRRKSTSFFFHHRSRFVLQAGEDEMYRNDDLFEKEISFERIFEEVPTRRMASRFNGIIVFSYLKQNIKLIPTPNLFVRTLNN